MNKLIASLVASSCATAFAAPVQHNNFHTNTHTYEFTQSYDLVVPQGSSGTTNLWIPLPSDTDYQTVKSIEFEGSYNTAYITENNAYGAKTLYATWDKDAPKRDMKVKLVIQTQDREPMAQGALKDYQMPEKIIYSVDVLEYLKPTAHIKTDGIVKEYADKIVGNEKILSNKPNLSTTGS